MKIGNFVDVNQKNLEITYKIPGNLLKNLEKSWKSHGILSVQKSGNPEKGQLKGACKNDVGIFF